MVRTLIFLLSLLPLLLFAGEFTATVSQTQVNVGDSFTLSLTLKDASPKGTPSVDTLKTSFAINSRQQSSNTYIVNGKVTSSVTWKYVLIPQKEGEITIPSLTLESSEGELSTVPIKISVVKAGPSTGSSSSATEAVTLTTDVSNTRPYKNEPFVYTIKLISKNELANIKMEAVPIQDAMIEKNGEPKVYEKNMNGSNKVIVEFSYLITPLKEGLLKIPSALIQGGVAINRNAPKSSLFDDDFDPFFLIGFDRLKPFALSTEDETINVQPAIAGINPWLPAKSLKIEEIWDDSQLLQVGEPITRSFKIVAEGLKSSQLPTLSDLQRGDRFFKVYGDKPELGGEGKDEKIKSYRKEQYTLIPQQAGSSVLPEISIVWWDTVNKEKVISRIPSRTLDISPSVKDALNSNVASNNEIAFTNPEPQVVVAQRDPFLYFVIGGLLILLSFVIVWGVTLQKKLNRSKSGSEPSNPKKIKQPEKVRPQPVRKEKPVSKDKREKLPDLNPT